MGYELVLTVAGLVIGIIGIVLALASKRRTETKVEIDGYRVVGCYGHDRWWDFKTELTLENKSTSGTTLRAPGLAFTEELCVPNPASFDDPYGLPRTFNKNWRTIGLTYFYENKHSGLLRLEAGEVKSVTLTARYMVGIPAIHKFKPQRPETDTGYVLSILTITDGWGRKHRKALCCEIRGWTRYLKDPYTM